MTSSAKHTEDVVASEVYVLDTNVLLADPNSLLSFPRAEVVIPETVLGELDKLKTARVDPDLRFRGREVSRILFELSEEGSLIGGVDLPEGGRVRVAPLDSDTELPEGLSTRNSDDRILATAYGVYRALAGRASVELVTNDLNMLLKAQTFGLPVRRHGEGLEGSFARRYIIRPFQRYKIPLGILAVALAVFAAVIVVAFTARQPGGPAQLPAEFQQLLSAQQQRAFQSLTTLQSNPEDAEALLQMGNFYFGLMETAQQAGDRAAAIQYSKQGIKYYERYLAIQPNDKDPRADMATLLFYSGQTDRAIQEVGTVLTADSNHVNANYNLGIFYWQGRRDLQAAADQMEKVLKLTENDQQQHGVNASAQVILEQINAERNGSTGATSTGETTP